MTNAKPIKVNHGSINSVYTALPKSPSLLESSTARPSYHSSSDVEHEAVTDKPATNGSSMWFMTTRLPMSTPHISNSQAFPTTSPRQPPEWPLPRSRLPRQPPGEVEKVVEEVRLYRC